MKVPYGKAVYNNDEIKAVISVLKKNTQMNEKVSLFEHKISKLFNHKYACMVNSGSSAIELIADTLNLNQNDEIISPALTFSTSLSPFLRRNINCTLIDVKPGFYTIDEDKIENSITKKTKAIVVPNLIGNLPNYKKIKNICNKYKLFLIEDSADTINSTYDGLKSGSYSDFVISSFYGSHVITCAGTGGIVCTSNKDFYKKIIMKRSWGRRSSLFDYTNSEKIENRFDHKVSNIPYDGKFIFDDLGYNMEPSEISAAFGIEQLKKLKKFTVMRNINFEKHLNFFQNYEDLFILPKKYKQTKNNWLAFPLTIKKNKFFDRKNIQIFFEKNGIQTRPIFTGNISKQPGFKKIKFKINKFGLSHTNMIMKNGFMIGCHQGLSSSQINYTHKIFKKLLGR